MSNMIMTMVKASLMASVAVGLLSSCDGDKSNKAISTFAEPSGATLPPHQADAEKPQDQAGRGADIAPSQPLEPSPGVAGPIDVVISIEPVPDSPLPTEPLPVTPKVDDIAPSQPLEPSPEVAGPIDVVAPIVPVPDSPLPIEPLPVTPIPAVPTPVAPVKAERDLAGYVNTLRGARSNAYIYDGYSRGNTFPAMAVPFGFNLWSPVNRIEPDDRYQSWDFSKKFDGYMGNDFFYTFFEDEAETKPLNQFYALAAVHEPSPWMGNRQSIQLMPVSKTAADGTPQVIKALRSETFQHKNEIARAHHYKVTFDNGTTAEMTPTDHAAYMRFTAKDAATPLAIVFDNFKDVSGSLKVDKATNSISGTTLHGAPPMYFYAVVDQPITAVGADQFPTWVKFDRSNGQNQVGVKIATSFISVEQAKANLEQEIGSKSFDTVLSEAKALWNEKLNAIHVEGASEDQKTILYSNLYRNYIYPNSAWENVDGKPVYTSPYTAKPELKSGKIWVNNGFWDTYRTTWPLYTLLDPTMTGELIDGFVNAYKDGGWVPRWSSPGYSDMMVATSSDIIFADAFMKGVRNFDVDAAYASMLRNASVFSSDSVKGRATMESAPFLGYNTKQSGGTRGEAVSWSLEAYLNDFGVAQMAKALGKEDDAAYFYNSAINYAKLFDATSTGDWAGGWLRERMVNGDFVSTVRRKPETWYHGYTEGNAWHYAFLAPQDANGLANLYGGKTGLKNKLDAFFTTKPGLGTVGDQPNGTRAFNVKPEIKSAYDVAAVANVGQYQHSNQPVHHSIYMYNYAGSPASGQKYLRDVMDKLYHSGYDENGVPNGMGYYGDEDNGEMSAWYIFSAMGFYPVSVGRPEYAIGAPYFEEMTVYIKDKEGNEKPIVVKAPNVSASNRYVQTVKLNGQNITRSFLTHAELIAGATIEFEMGPNPNPTFGSGANDIPTSLTIGDNLPKPLASLLPLASTTKTSSVADNLGRLHDRTSSTEWEAAAGKPWIQSSTEAERTVSIYTITSSRNVNVDPSAWVLSGSNDGTSWTVLDQRDNETFQWRRQTRPFALARPEAFKNYKLEFTNAGKISVAEVEFLAKQ